MIGRDDRQWLDLGWRLDRSVGQNRFGTNLIGGAGGFDGGYLFGSWRLLFPLSVTW